MTGPGSNGSRGKPILVGYDTSDEVDRVLESARARERMMRELRTDVRLGQFSEPVAELLDWPLDTASRCLAELDQPNAFVAGPVRDVGFRWLTPGPRRASCLAGIARIPEFSSFPPHVHLGRETVLILQGSCWEDSDGTVLRPGQFFTREPNTRHSMTVRPGPDLIYVAVVEEGIELDGGQRLVRGRAG